MKTIEPRTVVGAAANSVYARFRAYVAWEDLQQRGWLWIQEHPRKVERYLTDSNYRRAFYRFRRDLSMAMETDARAVRAQWVGYEPEDEYYYSAAQVRTLLPLMLDLSPGSTSAPDVVRRSVQDPSEGGGLQTAVFDLRAAWKRADLSPEDVDLMVRHCVDEESQQTIADSLNVDQKTISRRVGRIMRRLISELGGVRPGGCPFDCECHESALRVRPGVRSMASGRNQEVR